jgi:ribose transport system substrate-binding protein
MSLHHLVTFPRHIPRGVKFLSIVTVGAITLAACSTAGGTSSPSSATKGVDPKNLVLVESVRSLSNPYHALFDAMGGSGGIIALQGILDNVSAQQRYAGLQTALKANSGIQLLDQQTANWDLNQSFKVTQTLLAKYGDKVKGIWAANDNMALGAIQALTASGQVGKIPVVSASDAVPEALADIKAGNVGFLATMSTDAYWQGAVGLEIAYNAAIGKTDVATLTHEQRAFYGTQVLVTKDNVDSVLAPATADSLKADFADPYKRMTGPITK